MHFTSLIKMRLAALFSLTAICNCEFALAKMIVIDQRFIADSSSIVASFSKPVDQGITLRISFGGMGTGSVFEYVCPEKEWDRSQIEKISIALAQTINNEDVFSSITFLEAQGLGDCHTKRQ